MKSCFCFVLFCGARWRQVGSSGAPMTGEDSLDQACELKYNLHPLMFGVADRVDT